MEDKTTTQVRVVHGDVLQVKERGKGVRDFRLGLRKEYNTNIMNIRYLSKLRPYPACAIPFRFPPGTAPIVDDDLVCS